MLEGMDLQAGKPLLKFSRAYWCAAVLECRLNEGVDPKNMRKWFSFHSLRHTSATWLAQAGVPARRIQILIGHHSLKMTEVYTKVSDEDLINASETVVRAHELALYKDRPKVVPLRPKSR